MARLEKIQQRRQAQAARQTTQPEVQQQPPKPAEEPGIPSFTDMAEPYQPLERTTYAQTGVLPTMASSQAYRNDAMQGMNEAEFDRLKGRMNASDAEYWRAQVEKDPSSIYSNVNLMLASGETPLERQKRERREQLGQVFANLGNVIGNAANLAYAARGGDNIDLNAPMREENARVERIRERRRKAQEQADAIIRNAKLADLQGARELAAQQAKADAENNRFMLNLALRQQEAAAKARQQEADNERKDRELQGRLDNWNVQNEERRRHNLAMENKGSSGGSGSGSSGGYKVSFVGSDGKAYRFKDKDLAYGVASRAVNLIKRIAQGRVNDKTATQDDTDALAYINSAFFDSNNENQVLEFVRQNISRYPEVEEMIAADPDVYIRGEEEAVQSGNNAPAGGKGTFNANDYKRGGGKKNSAPPLN